MKHPYSEILHAIAEGKEVQRRGEVTQWAHARVDQTLSEIADEVYPPSHYRIKPETVRFNGVELPAPYMGELEDGKTYFYPSAYMDEFYDECYWRDSTRDRKPQQRGLVFLTKEDAAAWGKAMCPIKQE